MCLKLSILLNFFCLLQKPKPPNKIKSKKQKYNAVAALDEFEMLCVPEASTQSTNDSQIKTKLPPKYYRSTTDERRLERRSHDRRKTRNKSLNEAPGPDGICIQNYRSGCDNPQCARSHEFRNSRKMRLCKFYSNGCSRGANCVNMHEQFPCMHYYLGIDNHDFDRCKLMHGEPLDEELSEALLKHILHKTCEYSYMSEKSVRSQLKRRNEEIIQSSNQQNENQILFSSAQQ